MEKYPDDLNKWIDEATLKELQDAIRYEPIDSPLFRDETGDYFWKVYRKKMEELYGSSFSG